MPSLSKNDVQWVAAGVWWQSAYRNWSICVDRLFEVEEVDAEHIMLTCFFRNSCCHYVSSLASMFKQDSTLAYRES